MNALRAEFEDKLKAEGTDTWSAYYGTLFELEGPDTRYESYKTLNWVKGSKRTSPWLYCRRLPTEEAEKLLREKGWVYSPWREDPMWADLVAAEQNSAALREVAIRQSQEERSRWDAKQAAALKNRKEVEEVIEKIEALDPMLKGCLCITSPLPSLLHLLRLLS